MWHSRNLSQGTDTNEIRNRMMPQSQLNFDKSDLVRSKIKKIQESLLHVKPKGIIHQRFFFI
jgi:hypothetical protein